MQECVRVCGLDVLRQGAGRRGNETVAIPLGEAKVAGVGEVDLGV